MENIAQICAQLRARNLGCPAPLIQADDLVRLKDSRYSDTHRTRQSGRGIRAATATSSQKPTSRARFRWYAALNFDRLRDWLRGANRAMCVSLERSDPRSKRRTTHGLEGRPSAPEARREAIMTKRAPASDREALTAEIAGLSKLGIDELRERWKAICTERRRLGKLAGPF